MRRTDHNESEPRPRRGGRRRPSFGDMVGPGFVPNFARDEDESAEGADADDRGSRRGRGPRGHGFGPGGRGFGVHRGRRGRPRGDVRAAILLLLEEGPRHGYQLIQDITERSEGLWTPSAGSIYPTLQVLEDEGLISIESIDGRKTASLTESGGSYITENRERFGTPWKLQESEGEGVFALRDSMMGLMEASKQVFRVGSADQQRRAAQALAEARTAVYRILAEDGSEDA